MQGAVPALHADVAKHFRRNYFAHAIEGGLYIGGVALVSPHTVLPRMVESLGAPNWLVALTPVLLTVGFIAPGIFVAHRVERLSRLRPFILTVGVVQRIPYLAAAMILIYLATPFPELALPAVALTPLVSGLCGGVAALAWKEYVAKSIPHDKRASLWALRFVIAAAIGLLSAKVVELTLERYEPKLAYGLLHISAFALMVISYLVFAMTREPRFPSARSDASPSWGSFMTGLPAFLKEHRQLRYYLATLMLASGIFVMVPFLGIHALRLMDRPDSFLGQLLAAQMVGTFAGNVIGGFAGDRYGAKLPLALSYVAFVVLCVLSPVVERQLSFMLLFGLLGAALACDQVAARTLELELCPEQHRVRAQAVIGVFALAGLLSASLVSAVIRSATESFVYLALPALGMTSGALFLLAQIREPRNVS